jgi:hypothetical protein
MEIQKETVTDFYVAQGAADATPKQIISAWGFRSQPCKGITIRALSGNTIDLFVGGRGASVNTGFPLSHGEQVTIPIDDVTTIYVVATPANNTQQTVTVDMESGTFTLAGCDPVAYDGAGETLQMALEDVFGESNVSVAGDGPYTVSFVGDLAKTDVAAMVASSTNGSVAVVTTLASAGSRYSYLVV